MLQRLFYRYLMGLDLQLWDPRAIPGSELRAHNQLLSRPPLAAWLEVVAKGWQPADEKDLQQLPAPLLEEQPSHVLQGEALRLYLGFLLRAEARRVVKVAARPASSRAMGRELVLLLEDTDAVITTSTAAKGNLGYPAESGLLAGLSDKVQTFRFPSKSAIRQVLQAKNWWGS